MKLSTWLSVLKIARRIGKGSAKLRRHVEHLFRDRLRRLAAKRANRRRPRLAFGLTAGVLPLEERVLLSTATWDGGAGTLSWGDQANWSGDILPTSADDVVIGDLAGDQAIVVNLPVTIGSLSSAEGLDVLGGQSLTVTGATSSAVNGPFKLAPGAALSATSGASFTATANEQIDGASLYASGGGQIAFPTLSTYTGWQRNRIKASGVGSDGSPSRIDLSHVSTMTAPTYYWGDGLYINAHSGGVVDLSGVTSDLGGRFDLTSDGVGSTIDISRITSLSTTTRNLSGLWVSNGGTILDPLFTSLTRTSIHVQVLEAIPFTPDEQRPVFQDADWAQALDPGPRGFPEELGKGDIPSGKTQTSEGSLEVGRLDPWARNEENNDLPWNVKWLDEGCQSMLQLIRRCRPARIKTHTMALNLMVMVVL